MLLAHIRDVHVTELMNENELKEESYGGIVISMGYRVDRKRSGKEKEEGINTS